MRIEKKGINHVSSLVCVLLIMKISEVGRLTVLSPFVLCKKLLCFLYDVKREKWMFWGKGRDRERRRFFVVPSWLLYMEYTWYKCELDIDVAKHRLNWRGWHLTQCHFSSINWCIVSPLSLSNTQHAVIFIYSPSI